MQVLAFSVNRGPFTLVATVPLFVAILVLPIYPLKGACYSRAGHDTAEQGMGVGVEGR